jgi:hypothetical protein
MATFSIKQLPKTDSSLTRSPNFHKYYITCSGRITEKTPTSESWLHVLRLIKTDVSDVDKSRILLAHFEKYGEIVVKVGDSASMEREYMNSTRVHALKGFVTYICYFSCDDDFRSIPSKNRTSLCNGPGSTMGVLLMPYFELGSLASYGGSKSNMIQLRSCLKHAFLSIVLLFHKSNMIHGDFHPGNVLLKSTKQTEIVYNVPSAGAYSIQTHGLRTWIMDYENTTYANKYATIKSFNDFYYDIQKFFMLLYNTIKMIDPRTVAPIVSYISSRGLESTYLTQKDMNSILSMIDAVNTID